VDDLFFSEIGFHLLKKQEIDNVAKYFSPPPPSNPQRFWSVIITISICFTLYSLIKISIGQQITAKYGSQTTKTFPVG
jgi:uncharacterized membrane protein YhaH (DUF805 family)